MRELKFRFWDGEFMYNEYSYTDKGINETFNILKIYHEISDQFTGLLDSKGKEVYENDICVGKINGSSLFKVIWNKKMYRYSLMPLNGITQTKKGYQLCSGIISVIGNAHENPELLKPCED